MPVASQMQNIVKYRRHWMYCGHLSSCCCIDHAASMHDASGAWLC